jgi:hypothetical protein
MMMDQMGGMMMWGMGLGLGARHHRLDPGGRGIGQV